MKKLLAIFIIMLVIGWNADTIIDSVMTPLSAKLNYVKEAFGVSEPTRFTDVNSNVNDDSEGCMFVELDSIKEMKYKEIQALKSRIEVLEKELENY